MDPAHHGRSDERRRAPHLHPRQLPPRCRGPYEEAPEGAWPRRHRTAAQGRSQMTRAAAGDTALEAAWNAFPAPARACLENLRPLIHVTAAKPPAAGPLTETLKWGEPAFLTEATKSGTTIRLAWKPAL